MTDPASASITYLMVAYSLALRPEQAVLGETVHAVLRCEASGDVPEVITFEHASLTLTLVRSGSGAEPSGAFPNRRVVVRGDLVKRVAPSGGVEHLKAGDQRTREFTLLMLFPVQVLDLGEFDVGYTLYDGQRELGPKPAKLRIASRPASVPLLLALLDAGDFGTRARAAGLLHRMTGRGFDYDPEARPGTRKQAASRWRAWWKSVGSRIAWNYNAPGAAAGPVKEPPAGFQRGSRLGGVAYELQPLPSAVRSALKHWDPAILRSSVPPDGTIFESDAEIEQALAAGLDRLPSLSAGDAAVLLETAARVPSQGLVAPLVRCERAIPRTDDWSVVRILAAGLLDWLDPDRVPVWDASVATKKR
jgi:hypothetical protein